LILIMETDNTCRSKKLSAVATKAITTMIQGSHLKFLFAFILNALSNFYHKYKNAFKIATIFCVILCPVALLLYNTLD